MRWRLAVVLGMGTALSIGSPASGATCEELMRDMRLGQGCVEINGEGRLTDPTPSLGPGGSEGPNPGAMFGIILLIGAVGTIVAIATGHTPSFASGRARFGRRRSLLDDDHGFGTGRIGANGPWDDPFDPFDDPMDPFD